ncbi:MAG: DUF447 family protein [Sinobacteraceae bacterium]|nr:DUF447 family protein [Nevskiaceae bacterium]
MSLIREAIVSTPAPDGGVHFAPLGFRREGPYVVLAPYAPSRTLDNLRTASVAAISHTDDVRVFAGCLTGRRDWPSAPCAHIPCGRLAEALAHHELAVVRVDTTQAERPRFFCRELAVQMHRPCPGFNRAQAAVLEACILVSRLDRLPLSDIERAIQFLQPLVDKTAGSREREAWNWLLERIAAHRAAARAS